MGTTLTGDYIGFTYNGVPSSDLGIIRTSEGSRFNENLLPITQDKTVQVPGGDGTYFFGSYHASRQIQISYAFDALTEEDFARLQRHFGDKKIHDLTFDERPYKTYMAKVTGTSSIKHVPFKQGPLNRSYKGEGSLQFTAYQPYAKCRYKFLNDPYYKNISNIEEWNCAAKLLPAQGAYDNIENFQSRIQLYNPGDLEADFTFAIKFNQYNEIEAGKISIENDSLRQLQWKKIKKRNNDHCIKINTRLNLIEGYDQNNNKTGSIYNDAIIGGTFFKIPRNSDFEEINMILSDFGGADSNWNNILPTSKIMPSAEWNGDSYFFWNQKADYTAFTPISYNYYYL